MYAETYDMSLEYDDYGSDQVGDQPITPSTDRNGAVPLNHQQQLTPPASHHTPFRLKRPGPHRMHPYYQNYGTGRECMPPYGAIFPTPLASQDGDNWYEQTNSKITSLVNGHEKLVALLEKVSNRIESIEEKFLQTQSSSCGSHEEKKRIPAQLSKTIAVIHESLDNDKQFKPDLGAKDEHNKKVKKNIEEEISLNKENTFSPTIIERAIQRYFESRRRNWRESTDQSQQDRVAKQSKCRRVRSRRLRLFERRQKVVHEGQEMDRYSKLTLDFFSEESSSDESGAITVHVPEWRSQKLTSFFRELDQRVIDLNKESKRRIPERKERKVGTTLSSVPPSDAPKWTISKDWLKDHPDFNAEN